MTQQGEKKKKVDNDKLNHMIVHVDTFLEAVKAKPSMWVDERLEPLCDWHGYVSLHPDLFHVDSMEEPTNITKEIVSRLWD
jgi:hypothetical protein